MNNIIKEYNLFSITIGTLASTCAMLVLHLILKSEFLVGWICAVIFIYVEKEVREENKS